ncbi:MAG TPA: PilZ domain-containing protein [Thermodesulfobacteriota bacterium]|nr:PilZ domain-containing protein [Thermodesulfobacteriota bacterium]
MEKGLNSVKRSERYGVKILGNIVLESTHSERAYLGDTLNLSLSGALIETGHDMPVGTLFKYSFRIPGEKNALDIMSEVVRKAGPGEKAVKDAFPEGLERKNMNLYGIRFLDVKKEELSAIECFLCKN